MRPEGLTKGIIRMETLKKNLDRFFWLNYCLMLFSLLGFLLIISFRSAAEAAFAAAVLISYGFLYLLPAGLLITMLRWVCRLGGLYRFQSARVLVYAAAVVSMSLTHLLAIIDQVIYRMYSFHINGFVWNLVLTKGGIQSMAAGRGTVVVFFLVVAGILLAEILILTACIRIKRPFFPSKLLWRRAAAALLLLCIFLQAVGYGISSFTGYAPILTAAGVFPMYMPVTFRHQLEKLGFTPHRNTELTLQSKDSMYMNYPLRELKRVENPKHYNIVWLVAESLAAPMLTEEIMPATWAFSQKSIRFLNHYSGGSGTRMAVFSMFYGLYGNYWFPCLNEQRSPVLMDILQEDDYQIELFTSAAFTYPEFDKTVFARVPKSHMHEAPAAQGWESDRINVSLILDFLDKRDPVKPFMVFLFYESPHAPYNFPPETAIQKDYLKDFNYATTNIKENIAGIKNRYINACRHLDTQIERILNYLEAHSLLDSTIVIITGDHGEEFLEHGKWGHNSAFTEEQIQTPLVLWIPGQKPREIPWMTSHLDIPATLLTQLGVTNPPSDYSLGYDLLGEEKRTFTVVADWNSLCYVDADCKVTVPLKSLMFTTNKITTLRDQPADEPARLFAGKKDSLMKVMKDAVVFSSKQKKNGAEISSLRASANSGRKTDSNLP
jgi:hypothetical protein